METPGSKPAALLNFESNGSTVVSGGTRGVLVATRLIIAGIAGYNIGGESLGHRGCTVGAVRVQSERKILSRTKKCASGVSEHMVLAGPQVILALP